MTTHPDTSASGEQTRGSPRRRFARTRRLAVFLLVLYCSWCAVLFFKQTDLIFPRHVAGPALPEGAFPRGIERLSIDAEERRRAVRIEAWFFPAPRSNENPAPLVVYFHGNAELIDHNDQTIDPWLDRGYSALLVEYRGYGRSTGTPSERHIVEDSVRFVDLAAARPDVDKSRIVYHGRSIGSGIAAQVAVRRRPAAIILESPFTSVAAFAARYGVPPFVVSSPLRTDRALANMPDRPPTLILSSRDDEIVPFKHGVKLHNLLPGSSFFEMTGSHLAAIAEVPGVWEAIDEFLRKARLLD